MCIPFTYGWSQEAKPLPWCYKHHALSIDLQRTDINEVENPLFIHSSTLLVNDILANRLCFLLYWPIPINSLSRNASRCQSIQKQLQLCSINTCEHSYNVFFILSIYSYIDILTNHLAAVVFLDMGATLAVFRQMGLIISEAPEIMCCSGKYIPCPLLNLADQA